MAHIGTCFFDSKGNIHKSAMEAAKADLACIIGRIGEKDSLAPGIANVILEKRAEIEKVFLDFDDMAKAAPNVVHIAADKRQALGRG